MQYADRVPPFLRRDFALRWLQWFRSPSAFDLMQGSPAFKHLMRPADIFIRHLLGGIGSWLYQGDTSAGCSASGRMPLSHRFASDVKNATSWSCGTNARGASPRFAVRTECGCRRWITSPQVLSMLMPDTMHSGTSGTRAGRERKCRKKAAWRALDFDRSSLPAPVRHKNMFDGQTSQIR